MMGTVMTLQSTEWRRGKQHRMETSGAVPAMATVSVGDGKVMWTYMPNLKTAQRMDLDRINEATGQPGKIAPPSFYGIAIANVGYLGCEALAGEAVHVFEGAAPSLPAAISQLQPARIKVWIGAQDGVVRRQLGFDAQGKEVSSETRTGVQVDLPLPDSLFVFTPPEGIQVMDMTDTAIDMARKLQEPTGAGAPTSR
jgi:outer membrane lipoprotein-sorting protein